MATCGTTSPKTQTITFDRRIDGRCCSAVDALRRRLSRFRDRSDLPIASRAGNDRNANARSTGLHVWLDDQTLMKAVSAMLTDCSLSIALPMRDFNLS